MILVASLCVFIISFAACYGEENFQEISGWASADGTQVENKRNEMIEALLPREDNRCYGKPCSGNDECCVGAVCVDIEGASGTCLPTYVKQFHQACEEDKDCENGFVCLESGAMKTCQLEGRPRPTRGYNEPCNTSSECDTARGLCCQVLRRHRMAAKKICHYFIDPMSCIGEVQTDLKPLHYIPNPFFKARLG